MIGIKKVTVYCSSSEKIEQIYFEDASKVAKILVDNTIEVVFGGGSCGLMGKVADTVLENKGKIMGIIPEFLDKVEKAHPKVTKMLTVSDMSVRKKLLYDKTDAVVVLPGGSGTMDEMFDVITLKRLGVLNVPIVILNTNNFYEHLKLFFKKIIDEKFMGKDSYRIWKFIERPEELIQAFHEQLYDCNNFDFLQSGLYIHTK